MAINCKYPPLNKWSLKIAFSNGLKAAISQRWSNDYVISIRNDRHFKHRFSTRLKGNEILWLFLLSLILLLGLAFVLFRYTPLNNMVSTGKGHQKKELVSITNKADSLERLTSLNALFFNQIQHVLKGELTVENMPDIKDTAQYASLIVDDASKGELELRQKIEEQD